MVNDFWFSWCKRDDDTIPNIRKLLASDFIGFGSEVHEIWLGQNSMEQQLLHELTYFSEPILCSVKSMETKIFGSIAICLSDMIWKVKVKDKTIEIDPLRIITILKETDDKMEILSSSAIRFDDTLPYAAPHPGLSEPKRYEEISVLFTDFAGFTNTVSTIPPQKLVTELNSIFSEFDGLEEYVKIVRATCKS